MRRIPCTVLAGWLLLAVSAAPALIGAFTGATSHADRRAEAAGDPAATVRTYRVTYRVSGQVASATIDYRTRGGPIEHRTTQTLPWAVSLDMPVDDPLHLTVSGRAQWGEASITCEILVDGVVQARASGVGLPAVATCKARAAR